MINLSPQIGRNKFLWMIVEDGEIAYIIKKKCNQKNNDDIEVRVCFFEKMCDDKVHFNDVMLQYVIFPDELESIAIKKLDNHMKRR